ncbi:hypothetical protein GGI15_002174 [Coemansia interrupta]|uniref:Pre-rRNA-processing protein RIX1 n=1 Tax=Coemansia interrupta TaxID=1126814 RepID=A0A9W8HM40_9FUNG|nr:hypothetical protein GGI15_002174 [Coemansia interrupta]
MDANVMRAERTLTLLTSTYLANTEAAKTNLAIVVDTVLSQNLFSYIGQSGIRVENAKKYETAVQKWLARINSLSTGKTSEARAAGVMLMKQTALQSPPLLIENAAKWTATLLAILGKSEVTPIYQAVLQTLTAFLDIVREVPSLRREIASAQVPRINQGILALAEKDTELTDTVLDLLMCSASWYPSLFRPSIDKTEALCLRILDGTMARSGAKTCVHAAQCLASLASVGGKMTVDERWFYYAQLAMGTIDLCIDHVMCKDVTQTDDSLGRPHFELSQFSDSFTASIPQAIDRITSMTDILIALLARPVAVDIPIPVDALVSIASRLALIPVRIANSKSTRAEFDLIPMLTPEIQRSSVRILATLAISLGNSMTPYLSAVARIVAVINTRYLSSATAQVALYALVRLYIERYDYGFAVLLSKEVIESAIDHVNVQSKRQSAAVTATAQASALRASGSKKRGGNGKSRAAEEVLIDENVQESQIHWSDVVCAALGTVTAILSCAPTIITASMRTALDSQVLTLLMLDMIGGVEASFASRHTDKPYKAALYKCLEASVLAPDFWNKAILPHALTVFSAGLSDMSPTLRAICNQALASIEPMVHARLPAQLRAPDSEKGYEEAIHAADAMFDNKHSIDAALTEMAISDNAESEASKFKRYKQDTGSVGVPVADATVTGATGPANSKPFAPATSLHDASTVEASVPDILPLPKSSPTYDVSAAANSEPLAASGYEMDASVSTSVTSTVGTAPSFNNESVHSTADANISDNDDAIPDIVMEDSSDSDEEDEDL